ncbi:hypothetical protein VCM52_001158 [Escherichia coli]|nr:hypothetical protein [Escherichia coli]EMC3009613.1 hypothetical protein [Escherichia coli]EMC6800483.1 hypothetical protein [Escherichia coli]
MLAAPFSDPMLQVLAGDPTLVMAIRLLLPSGTCRAHSGVGTIVINGEPYYGVGALGSIQPIRSSSDSSPTQVQLQITGFDSSLVATILNEKCRGAGAYIYLVAIGDNGYPLAADLLYGGFIAKTGLAAGKENAITVVLSNKFERWSIAKPDRFTDESWKKRHKGDRIFRYVAQMSERPIYWGSKKDAPAFNYE